MSKVNLDDVECLLRCKHILEGDSGDILNWKRTIDPWLWDGVAWINGRVSMIQLPGKNLKGHIPLQLMKLDALKTIDLENNDLTGGVPTEMIGASFQIITEGNPRIDTPLDKKYPGLRPEVMQQRYNEEASMGGCTEEPSLEGMIHDRISANIKEIVRLEDQNESLKSALSTMAKI